MAASSKDAWKEVGDRFGEWSKVLGERYRKRGEELGASSDEDKRKLEEAVNAVTRQIDQAFTSLGDTLRDPEAKQRLKEATKSLGTALSSTFTDVGEQVRTKLGRSDPSDSDAPERPDQTD